MEGDPRKDFKRYNPLWKNRHLKEKAAATPYRRAQAEFTRVARERAASGNPLTKEERGEWDDKVEKLRTIDDDLLDAKMRQRANKGIRY